MEILHKPHDGFFRTFFGRTRELGELLQQILPAELFRQLDPGSLKVEPDSYLDEKGREYFSDIAGSATIAGQKHKIYILVEHKSWPNKWVHLQMYHYIYRIWKQELKEQKSSVLCPVLPILFYHGPTRRIDPSLRSLFPPSLSAEIRGRQPELDLIIYNLSLPETIPGSCSATVAAALYSLKYARDNLTALLRVLNRLAREGGTAFLLSPDFKQIQTYIFSASSLTEQEIHQQIYTEVTNPVLQEEFMSTAQLIMQRGRQEGMREKAREDARRMLDKGFSIQDIVDITGLSEQEIKDLQEPHNQTQIHA
ncbi:conserved hypothetical protein (putative transposase or invertase) [Alkalispirochaeta americana]|uniref:Transposase (putative) YhgA-like domain-containing protein n=1 Tax=Alkalispirochaeta americana TaxID=159291 RepID=A0A1N6Q4G6_9SPIO|nr:Rpn family recombination-promoting nuclease/putative transposase [Alkalispirochaeta americana]SIQ11493.1 conserved hypothetical protein (putative transposase or invertase) [Alkalispirochaeta americana]